MAIDVFVSSFGLASALGIAALGVIALLGGRSRPRGALAFGLFALVWGIQIALSNLSNLTTDARVFEVLIRLVLAGLIALPYFLTESILAWLHVHSRFARIWRGVVIATSLGTALIFALAPDLLYSGATRGSTGKFLPSWGPLHVLLISFPLFLTFALALPALALARARAPTHRIASRVSTLLAGFGLYVGFAAGNNLFFFATALYQSFDLTLLLFAAVFFLLSASTIGVAVWLLAQARVAIERKAARRDRFVAAALLVPFVLGVVELVYGPERFESTGLWRLAGVGVLTYGIARWRVWDLPQRATKAAASATGASAAVATGAVAYGAGAIASASTALPVLLGVLVTGAALLPALSIARRFFGVDRLLDRRDPDAYRYGQRIDAYRAALEASLARDTFDEDQEFLAALRERFGISPDEDRLLVHLARSSVIVSRDRNAWDAYERLRLLGEGGSGRTWLARDRGRDRLVVLKEPLERWQKEPAAREAVLREARLAAKVRHANVVAVEEVVEGKGSPVIVMEYLEGGSLAQLLRARGTLPWAEARALLLDILRGLEAIHAAGIVHRDVKPSNVLLTGEGIAKLADFGIAIGPATRAGGDRTVLVDPSQTGAAGTLLYMAPEARAGAAPEKVGDVFACAAVLHEMLYGAPPGLPSPLVVRNDVPKGVAALLARGLAPQPSARIPSARAFADELSKLV